jgi:hypothetical protein
MMRIITLLVLIITGCDLNQYLRFEVKSSVPVNIDFRINDGTLLHITNVTLPWEYRFSSSYFPSINLSAEVVDTLNDSDELVSVYLYSENQDPDLEIDSSSELRNASVSVSISK